MALILLPCLLAAGEPVAKAAVPPVLRARMMMALLGLVVLGIGLAAAVLVGGWMVRRVARQRTAPSGPLDDAWYAKPLVPPPAEETEEGDRPE